MSKRFHQIEIGQKFQSDEGGPVYTKLSKSAASGPYWTSTFNSQALVTPIEDEEVNLEELDFHTFDFTDKQLAEVIRQIVERAKDDYGADRINADRLTKGLYAAHRAKPIRLIALLNACPVDFPADVLYGVYRHYDPATDSIKGGWTAQHAEPHTPDIFDLLFGRI